MSADDAFAPAKYIGRGANLAKSDDGIDNSNIPRQDSSGPSVVGGKYREFALLAQRLVALDADARRAFTENDAVDRALRAFI